MISFKTDEILGPSGYLRRLWFEKIEDGPFGPSTLYYSPSYYKCEVYIPQVVFDFDPYQIKSTKNQFLVFQSSNEGVFRIPIYKSRDEMNVTSNDGRVMTSQSTWLLRFRYNIKEMSLKIQIEEGSEIWKVERDTITWKSVEIVIRSNDVKYDDVIIFQMTANDF